MPVAGVKVTILPKLDLRDGAGIWSVLAVPAWIVAMHVGYWLATR